MRCAASSWFHSLATVLLSSLKMMSHGLDPNLINKFPGKLWGIINTCKSGAIKWGTKGRSVVLNQLLFEKEYLAADSGMFKTQSIASFIRQLNLYGFKKITAFQQIADGSSGPMCADDGSEILEFFHENFRRNRPDLLVKLRRNVGIRRSREIAMQRKIQYELQQRGRAKGMNFQSVKPLQTASMCNVLQVQPSRSVQLPPPTFQPAGNGIAIARLSGTPLQLMSPAPASTVINQPVPPTCSSVRFQQQHQVLVNQSTITPQALLSQPAGGYQQMIDGEEDAFTCSYQPTTCAPPGNQKGQIIHRIFNNILDNQQGIIKQGSIVVPITQSVMASQTTPQHLFVHVGPGQTLPTNIQYQLTSPSSLQDVNLLAQGDGAFHSRDRKSQPSAQLVEPQSADAITDTRS